MTTPHPAFQRKRRWAVLAAYTLVVGVSQMLWLNFAPLLSLVQTRYGVSELTASMLVLVFPLLYVVFSLPAGTMTDTCVVGQVGIAIAQPYVVNGISKRVADRFR